MLQRCERAEQGVHEHQEVVQLGLLEVSQQRGVPIEIGAQLFAKGHCFVNGGRRKIRNIRTGTAWCNNCDVRCS